MAEGKPARGTKLVRPLVLVVLVGVAAFFIWRAATRTEGYTGGDITTTGTVEAVHVQLGFKLAGRIADVGVTEGTRVAPGQIVARLESQDLEVAVANAHANLEAARAALAEAQATRVQKSRDLSRQTELLARDVATQQQADDARAASAVADAQVRARNAQVHQAETAVRQAELERSYADLRATEAGEVQEKVHQPGEMVMLGAPVVTLVQADTVKVHAAVDETQVGAIRPGDTVHVKVYTFDQRTFDGVVTDVEPVGEFATRKDWGAQRRDIRTFTVTARVPNPDHLLKDGMTADVTIAAHPSRPVAEAEHR